MEELVTLHIYASDYDLLGSWQLATWCKRHGADEWTIAAITVAGAKPVLFERFDENAKHFKLPMKKRRHLTASGPNDFTVPTELWRLTSASFAILQEFLPDGLFTNRSNQEGWFEDPAFYREGQFMLGVVSHENEGIVRVTKSEQHSLEAEGFAFRPYGEYVGY